MATTADGIGNSATGIKGIHHVSISVADLDRTATFFEKATTLPRAIDSSFSGKGLADSTPLASAVIKGPNAHIELMQFADSKPGLVPVEGPGFTHICFQSPTTTGMYNKFKAAGATAVSWGDEPIDLGGYGVQYAYLRDADNAMYEVEHVDRPPFEGEVWIGHVALVSYDIDRLVEFYKTLFEIEPYRRANKATGPRIEEVTGLKDARMRAAWFNVANMVLEIWEFVTPATPTHSAERPFEQAGFNKFAFEVTNIEREITRLSDAGVQFVSEVLTTPIGLEVYALDPDGNRFSLVQLNDDTHSIDQLKHISWQTA